MSLATVVTRQTMRAGKERQDRGLQVLIEHLHLFFSDDIMFEFDLPRQVDPDPPGVSLEESTLSF